MLSPTCCLLLSQGCQLKFIFLTQPLVPLRHIYSWLFRNAIACGETHKYSNYLYLSVQISFLCGSNTWISFTTMPNTNQGPAEEEDNSLAPFQALIRKWDEERTNQQYDPTETLNQMSEILEKVSAHFEYFLEHFGSLSKVQILSIIQNCYSLPDSSTPQHPSILFLGDRTIPGVRSRPIRRSSPLSSQSRLLAWDSPQELF